MVQPLDNNALDNRVNIIIVNYNSYSYTTACIASLLKSTYENFRVFIVDNLSDDDSLDHLEKWLTEKKIPTRRSGPESHQIIRIMEEVQTKVILIQNDRNAGFGAGNNVAIKPISEACEGEFIWLLNPDTEAEAEVLGDLVSVSGHEHKVISGNAIYEFNNRDRIIYCGGFKVQKNFHGMTDIKEPADIHRIDAIAGASLFTKVETFRDLGLFPEHYFMYWEETDFCTKAKRNDYEFRVNHRSKIFDHVGATADGSFLREYLYLLNGLRYHKKYNKIRMPLILISTILKLIKAILMENRVKQKALYYAHVDFFKMLTGKDVEVRNRILHN